MPRLPDLHVHVHIHVEDGGSLLRIEHKLDQIITKENTMALDITALEDAVTRDTDAVNSAITLLTTLADELREAAADPAAVQAIADSLNANSQALADAVVANTPAG